MDDVLNNQEDLGTRIETKIDKESPEVEKDADMVIINNEEEEESVGDEFELRKREKGKGIEDNRDTPPPIPIRSLRTHISPLSSDKETLQELMITIEEAPLFADRKKLQELTVTDSTPSSSLPKPKTERFRRTHRTTSAPKTSNPEDTKIESSAQRKPTMIRFRVPRRPYHETPIQIVVENVDVDAFMDDVLNNQEDLGTRIETKIDKESPEVEKDADMDNEKLRNDDLSIWWSLKIKFDKPALSATLCQTAAICPRDHGDHHDDAHHEGENSSCTQEQLDEFDAWMDGFGTDDNEVPTEEVSQELWEEISGEIDEAQVQKAVNDMKERLSLLNLQKPTPVYHNCHRDPKALPITLLNQDLFYLKYGNSRLNKYTLSLHKFPVYLWAKQDHTRRQKELRDKPKEVYSELKIIEVIRTSYELGHEHKLIIEIVVRRANGKINPIKESDYKYLNKNDIEDLYFLCVNGKRVLEIMKKYNKDMKYGYVIPSPSDADSEYLKFYKEDIEDHFKRRDQMRRLEMYVNGRPLGSRRDHPE
nr:hypothetical protein [Tanacetum cinerariifolium]